MPKYLALLGALAILGTAASAQAVAKLPRKNVDLVCMQKAVDKRDAALISNFDVFHTAISSALQTRRDALKAAWALTTIKTRHTAIQAAWKTYRDAAHVARQVMNKSRVSAWQTYNQDAKACRTVVGEDKTNISADANL